MTHILIYSWMIKFHIMHSSNLVLNVLHRKTCTGSFDRPVILLPITNITLIDANMYATVGSVSAAVLHEGISVIPGWRTISEALICFSRPQGINSHFQNVLDGFLWFFSDNVLRLPPPAKETKKAATNYYFLYRLIYQLSSRFID